MREVRLREIFRGGFETFVHSVTCIVKFWRLVFCFLFFLFGNMLNLFHIIVNDLMKFM